MQVARGSLTRISPISLLCKRFASQDHKHSRTNAAIQLASEFPSDFTLQYPPRREYYKELYRSPNSPKYLHDLVIGEEGNVLSNTMESPLRSYQKEVLLYCHIPFCEHKCFFCNFAVDTRTNQNQLHDEYVKYMVEGLHRLQDVLHDSNIPITMSGIDIGGGTPTLLEPKVLERFLTALKPIRDQCTHAQPLSIETTPAIASSHIDRLHILKEGGVDRVSMGLQSTDNDLLSSMNRGKETSSSANAIQNIQKVGFSRFSVDIIFGLPNQEMKHWKNDLQRIIDFDIQIVTTYDCLYRGKGRAMTKNSAVPTPEQYGEFYDFAFYFLTKHGFYAPYGSVNFTKHNGETGTSAYFEGRLLDGLQFLGLGNYSSSVFEDKWWFAPYSVDQWMQDIDQFPNPDTTNPLERLSAYFPLGDSYTLPIEERAAKYLLLSLSFGIIDPKRFYHIFNRSIDEFYGENLSRALHEGWMYQSEETGCYYIVEGQFKNISKIRSLFYSPNAIEWLQNVRDNPQEQYKHRKTKIRQTADAPTRCAS